MLDVLIKNPRMRKMKTLFSCIIKPQSGETNKQNQQGIYSISVFIIQVINGLIIQAHTLTKPSVALSHLKNSFIK